MAGRDDASSHLRFHASDVFILREQLDTSPSAAADNGGSRCGDIRVTPDNREHRYTLGNDAQLSWQEERALASNLRLAAFIQ